MSKAKNNGIPSASVVAGGTATAEPPMPPSDRGVKVEAKAEVAKVETRQQQLEAERAARRAKLQAAIQDAITLEKTGVDPLADEPASKVLQCRFDSTAQPVKDWTKLLGSKTVGETSFTDAAETAALSFVELHQGSMQLYQKGRNRMSASAQKDVQFSQDTSNKLATIFCREVGLLK